MGSAEQRGVGLTEQRLISITRTVRRDIRRPVVLEHLRKPCNEHRALNAIGLSDAAQLVEVVIDVPCLHAGQRLEWVAGERGHGTDFDFKSSVACTRRGALCRHKGVRGRAPWQASDARIARPQRRDVFNVRAHAERRCYCRAMTVPEERTRAVLQTRRFLQQLSARADVPKAVRLEAERLLRHYPDAGHIDAAAAAWPQWWAPTGHTHEHAPSYLELLARVRDGG